MSVLKKTGLIILAKASIITSAILTYAYHDDLKKLEYSLFEKRAPVAESFYGNPPILSVKWQPNDQGQIETYLINTATGKKIEIMYDMMPRNSTMIEAMGKRSLDGFQIGLSNPASLEARLYFTEVQK